MERQNETKKCETASFSLRVDTEGISSSLRRSFERIFAEASLLRSSMIPFFTGTGLRGFDISLESGICIDTEGRIREFEYEFLTLPMRRCLMNRFIEEMKESGRRARPAAVTRIDFTEYGKTHAVIGNGFIAIAGIREYIPVEGLSQFWKVPGLKPETFRLIKTEEDEFLILVKCRKEAVKAKESPLTLPGPVKSKTVLGIYFEPFRGVYTSEGDILRGVYPMEFADSEGYIDPDEHMRELEMLEKAYRGIMDRLSKYDTVLVLDNDVSLPDVMSSKGKEYMSILSRVRDEVMKMKNTVKMSPYLKPASFCPRCGRYEKFVPKSPTWKCRTCGHMEEKSRNAAMNLVWFYEHGIGIGRSKSFEIEERIRKVFSEKTETKIS